MTIDQTARHRLHQSLERTLGEENAAVLMEHLPPSGWTDVATRRDLDHLHVVLRAEVQEQKADLQGQILALETTMYRLFNKMLLQLIGAMAGLLTVFFVLTRAAG